MYELIASHGDVEDMMFFAVLMRDFERVISHHLQQDDYHSALSVLAKQVRCYSRQTIVLVHIYVMFFCIVGRIVQSLVKWAGNMVRMKDEGLPKISETEKQECCRKRGRPHLRSMEDCVERDLRKAEEGRKIERKGQQHGAIEFFFTKVAVLQSDN